LLASVDQGFPHLECHCPLPATLLLAVALSACAYAASPTGTEAPLSRKLRTSPLPATHFAVGNSWQNRRLCQQYLPDSSYVSDFVSHQRLVRPGLPPIRLPPPFVFLDLLLGHMLAKELSHQLGDLVAVRFQGEVAGVKQVVLQRLQVAL